MDVTDAVRGQYERDPYPRWTSPPRSSDELRDAVPAPRQALVAGCGTGRDACSVALTFPDAWVVGVDVSKASLNQAVDHARRHGVRNVAFRHFDLLRLVPRFAGRFDLALAVGVLHHLETPEQGLGILARTLAPGGCLVVGLYSRVGRREVLRAREIAYRLGYQGEEPVRFARDAVAILPAETYTALSRYPDFHYPAGVRDLIFPAREVYLDPPDIAAALRRVGFEVERMLVRPHVLEAFDAEIGEHRRRDLLAWGEFEKAHPDTFRAMYRFVAVASARSPQ